MPRARTPRDVATSPASSASSPRSSPATSAGWPAADDSFELAGVSYQLRPIRCGKATCLKWHGPYWYAFWWSDGRTRCKYIGKKLPAEVAAARDGTAATAPASSVPREPTDAPTQELGTPRDR